MNKSTNNNDEIILDGLNKCPELHKSPLQKQSSPPSNLVHVSEVTLSAFKLDVKEQPR